jgi:hypothetical protein
VAYFGFNETEVCAYWRGDVPDTILAKVVFREDGGAILYTAPRNQDDKSQIMDGYLGYIFRPDDGSAVFQEKFAHAEMHFIHHIEP